MSPTSERERTGPPPQRARWLYARGNTWAAFQPRDNDKLEHRWNRLGGEQWARHTSQNRVGQADKKQSTTSSPRAPPSRVDAVQSTLHGPADPANNHAQSQSEASSKKTSSDRSWFTGLRQYIALGKDESSQGDESSQFHSDQPNAQGKESNSADADEVQVNYILDPDEPESERAARVEVMEDNLFDVDLESMTLYPVFWKGVLLKVVRATWFYSSLTDGSYAPISWDDPLSCDLDHAYSKARPWLDHCSSPSANSPDVSEAKEQFDEAQLLPLPSMTDQAQVCFQDAEVGRIFSEDLRGRFLSIVGGSIVVRGFDRAERIAEQKSFNPLSNITLPWSGDEASGSHTDNKSSSGHMKPEERSSSIGAQSASTHASAAKAPTAPPSGGGADGPDRAGSSTQGDEDKRQSFAAKLIPSSDTALRPLVALRKLFGYDQNVAADEEKRKIKQEMTKDELDRQRRSENDLDLFPDDRKNEPPELVFAIHGIGQQLTEDFEALDFVYDVEHLRNLASENASDPAVRRLSRGRRAQFIPICWRRFMEFDEKSDTNDNFYTLEDITSSAAIPVVRNFITKVALDVPFYLSRHRQKMIDSVRSELNRTYRLFCRRNPEFEKHGGRVSVIGHSLGSALAADILSAQPSKVPPLSEVSKSDGDVLRSNNCLLFNVKNLFFIGSPVAFFFHLDGGQLIARSGTERNPENNSDALDGRVGRYGCLAAESVYNIFNPNDPVAFQLAPTVDSAYAKLIKPISIESATEALLCTLALPRISVSHLFEKYKEHPFQAVGKVLRQARILEDNEEELPSQSLSHKEREQVKDRRMGQRIVRDSDYIQTVRKWHHLQRTSPNSSSQTPSNSTPYHEELETETGTLKKALQPSTALLTSSIPQEESHHFDLAALERAERRFTALNPHGCIDYHLSAGISLSGYLDMFGAHLAYWTHRDFAMFVLTQLFMDYTKQSEVTIVPEIRCGPKGKDSKGDNEDKRMDQDGETGPEE